MSLLAWYLETQEWYRNDEDTIELWYSCEREREELRWNLEWACAVIRQWDHVSKDLSCELREMHLAFQLEGILYIVDGDKWWVKLCLPFSPGHHRYGRYGEERRVYTHYVLNRHIHLTLSLYNNASRWRSIIFLYLRRLGLREVHRFPKDGRDN